MNYELIDLSKVVTFIREIENKLRKIFVLESDRKNPKNFFWRSSVLSQNAF